MINRDPNSQGQDPKEDAGEATEPPKSRAASAQTGTVNIRWIRGEWSQGERRLPENARIRRWMDLADKALQGTDEDPIPTSQKPDKAGD